MSKDGLRPSFLFYNSDNLCYCDNIVRWFCSKFCISCHSKPIRQAQGKLISESITSHIKSIYKSSKHFMNPKVY